MQELFAPPGLDWRRISPLLGVVRRVLLAAVTAAGVLLLGVAAALDALPAGWVIVLVVLLLLGFGWGWWVIGRSVRRWGYAELEDELYITRGAMFRKLIVVPYGRMQFVDVHSGPVDRWLGIATVHLHTASPGTTAVIPGLVATEAARLRDRLTVMGEAGSSGL